MNEQATVAPSPLALAGTDLEVQLGDAHVIERVVRVSRTLVDMRGGRIVGRSTLNRYKQTVGVPVNLAARTVVSVERMSRLERKFFSQSDNCHIAKIV